MDSYLLTINYIISYLTIKKTLITIKNSKYFINALVTI